jgi:hypothetical protein
VLPGGTLQEAWQTWEASGQEFWQQMDGVVAMPDGLVGEVSFTDVVKENQECWPRMQIAYVRQTI